MDYSSSYFLVSIEGPIAQVSLNRPQKANAMTRDFWIELPRILGLIESDPQIRCVVLTGEGKHFTGGMDLAVFGEIAKLLDQEPGRAANILRDKILSLQNTFNAIERLRIPVIAAIHGACIGGGMDMITACDIRLASSDAYFSVEEINIGMTADVGTLQRLPKLIAPSVAAELALTGRRFSAAEAQNYGLISLVTESRENLLVRAVELARDIAQKSPLAVTGIKRNLAYSRDHSVADGLDYVATWNAGMLRADDLTRAATAALSRKQAVFDDLLSIDSANF